MNDVPGRIRGSNMQHANVNRTRQAHARRLNFIRACALSVAVLSVQAGSSADRRVNIIKGSMSGALNFNVPPTKMDTNESQVIEARRARADFAVDDFDNAAWRRARTARIERYWSGEIAPRARQAEARVLWTDAALYVRFVARQGEPLVVNDHPRFDVKTMGLWDRDVCELFVAPNADEPERYFEFEVAPTGEWLDARIHQLPDKRESDFDYSSGATFAARTTKDSITMTMRVPWSALGGMPQKGARWRANLYRCVGKDPTRGYLAWQPTLTPEPGFHVPAKFGWLHFNP